MSGFPELNSKTTRFHSPIGLVLAAPVDDPEKKDRDTDGLFELSVRQRVDPESLEEEKSRWRGGGGNATNAQVLSKLQGRSRPAFDSAVTRRYRLGD